MKAPTPVVARLGHIEVRAEQCEAQVEVPREFLPLALVPPAVRIVLEKSELNAKQGVVKAHPGTFLVAPRRLSRQFERKVAKVKTGGLDT